MTHPHNNILIMSIQFPILNISLSNLRSQDLEETHIGDLWDYPGDNSILKNTTIIKNMLTKVGIYLK